MNPVTRRQMLQQSGVGFGYLAAQALLAEESRADAPASISGEGPLAPRPPHFPARAKRIIFLFMVGGPSHVDTFDFKPLLKRDHGRPYPFQRPSGDAAGTLMASPWKFHRAGQCGIPVSELFPNVARCVDDICFINSVHGTSPAHNLATLKLHTGSSDFRRPSIGSWITYGLGTENRDLPGFVTICPTLKIFGNTTWSSAMLPATYQGTMIGNARSASDDASVGYIHARLPERIQRLQLDRLLEMNRAHQQHSGPETAFEARIASFELAFRMQSSMTEAFDLASETQATRRLYGLDAPETRSFGRRCLLARRLAERGVRFIQVTHADETTNEWDQHYSIVQGHTKNSRAVDQPIAGLLRDLKARGLLDDTLVWWGGEFGRTPTVQGQNDAPGRDHNTEGFTMWLAGGGVKGGLRYGSTDDYGWVAAENKVHIHDLHATILHLLGLDHERLTYRHAGQELRLTNVSGNVARDIIS